MCRKAKELKRQQDLEQYMKEAADLADQHAKNLAEERPTSASAGGNLTERTATGTDVGTNDDAAEAHEDDEEHDEEDHEEEEEHEDEEEEEGDGFETGEPSMDQYGDEDEFGNGYGEEDDAERDQLESAERDRLAEVDEEELMRQKSAGQKRMKYFLDKVKQSTARHASHPRQQPGKFFMPLNFSEDIYFDPFETEISDANKDLAAALASGGRRSSMALMDAHNGGAGDGSSAPSSLYGYLDPAAQAAADDPFNDVNSRLADFRKEEEKRRKLLFTTTLQEVPSNEWIRVFRTYTVDWDSFFANQDAMVELTEAVRQSELEYETHFLNKDPLKRATDMLSSTAATPVMSRNGSFGSGMSGDWSEDTNIVVTLLPYGKILEHQKLRPGNYKYYKIEQKNALAQLTIEVQCTKGMADVYLSFQKLPSMSLHDKHVACTKENKGTVRLAFRPHKAGTFFVAIRSHEKEAEYNIWTYSSNHDGEKNPIIARVNRILRKFEILAAVPEQDLQEFFPKFEKEANKMILEEEQAAAKQLADEEPALETAREELCIQEDDASLNTAYDVENVHAFIRKISKYTLMHDIDGEDDVSYLDDHPPNNDDEFQEFGQEIEDIFMPLHASNLQQAQAQHHSYSHAHPIHPHNQVFSSGTGALVSTNLGPAETADAVANQVTSHHQQQQHARSHSLPSLGTAKSELTPDSWYVDDSGSAISSIADASGVPGQLAAAAGREGGGEGGDGGGAAVGVRLPHIKGATAREGGGGAGVNRGPILPGKNAAAGAGAGAGAGAAPSRGGQGPAGVRSLAAAAAGGGGIAAGLHPINTTTNAYTYSSGGGKGGGGGRASSPGADSHLHPHSTSTVRLVAKSKSAISLAREFAALDEALRGPLTQRREKPPKPVDTLLHQYPKPIKYQMRGTYN
jgi:hypothetical protein